MLHLHSYMVGCMYNFYCILFMSNSLDFFFSYVSWMQYFFLNIFERVGLLDRVGKKPVVADKRVYQVSRKFIRFTVFLSDKI